ncbi:MAG: hypothetical protein QNL01_05180 [Akkermansiaceae bacterium]
MFPIGKPVPERPEHTPVVGNVDRIGLDCRQNQRIAGREVIFSKEDELVSSVPDGQSTAVIAFIPHQKVPVGCRRNESTGFRLRLR